MTEKKTKLHGIQLTEIKIVQLSIKVNQTSTFIEQPNIDFSINQGHTKYDQENKKINVAAKLITVKKDDQENPFDLVVELFGVFVVDESHFPIEHIEDWAKRNAIMLLIPFLREHVYSLTVRCGLPPMIVPLFTVPTLKIKDDKESTSTKDGDDADTKKKTEPKD
jgi:preprotein translocase subunit SecB